MKRAIRGTGVILAATLLLSSAPSVPAATQDPTPLGACDAQWRREPVEIDREAGYLSDVDALSATQAWAVGQAFDMERVRNRSMASGVEDASPMSDQGRISPQGGPSEAAGPSASWIRWKRTQQLILEWDGSSWTPMEVPSFGPGRIRSISVLAADDIWAVGTESAGDGPEPLILHYDGANWTVIPPMPNAPDWAWLDEVVAIGPDDVWAVGGWEDRRISRGLLAHFDGVDWSVVPGPKTWSAWYEAVAASGPDDVWAGGIANRISGIQGFYAQHFDGTDWTRTPTGGHDAGSFVTAAEAFSTTDAWIGGWFWGWRRVRPILQHWDGVEWTNAADLPNPGDNGSVIEDTASISPTSVYAVGGAMYPWDRGWIVPEATMWHGNAGGWDLVTVPQPGNMSYLAGVDIAADGFGVAVGNTSRRVEGGHPLILNACI